MKVSAQPAESKKTAEPGKRKNIVSEQQKTIDNSPTILAQQQYIASVFPQSVQRKEAFPPGTVIQAKLKETATYRVLMAVDYYDDPGSSSAPAKKKLKSTIASPVVKGLTELGKLYTVMESDDDWTKLKLATTDGKKPIWIETDTANEASQWLKEPEIGSSIIRDTAPEELRWKEFKKNPMPVDPVAEDVVQGEVGDCWLMACMAALASSSEWISKLKDSVVVNIDGTVTIKLFEGGKSLIKPDENDAVPVDSIVSTWLPSYVQKVSRTIHKDLLYASTKKGAIDEEDHLDVNVNPHIWPALIEKGVAALANNQYSKLDNKSPEKGFATLTGGKGMQVYANKDIKTAAWGNILSVIAAGGAGTVSTKSNHTDMTSSSDSTEINATTSKMISNHVYYIVSADVSAETLTVKNPHQTVDPAPFTIITAKEYLTKIVVIPKP